VVKLIYGKDNGVVTQKQRRATINPTTTPALATSSFSSIVSSFLFQGLWQMLGSRKGHDSSLEPAEVTSLDFDMVTHFSPLYVGPPYVDNPQRVNSMVFDIISEGIPGSFAYTPYALPTTGAGTYEAHPTVSTLQNFFVQRGLARNKEMGVSSWLNNQTLNLVCNASMDPFASGPPSTTYYFSRWFDPETGDPLGDMYGQNSTLAAAVVLCLLYPDAAADNSSNPPISHNVTFALVVAELVIAFATGMVVVVVVVMLLLS